MNYLTALYRTFGAKVVRFFIAGGSAAATNLTVFYVCTTVFTVYYIWASIIAYALAFFVSFTLQKFWTFRDSSLFAINKQVLTYFLVSFFNLVVNTILIYTLVEFGNFVPLYAQTLVILLIATWSFFVYNFFIFKSLGK